MCRLPPSRGAWTQNAPDRVQCPPGEESVSADDQKRGAAAEFCPHNRVIVRPQLGVIHNRGKWSTELTGAAWFFTDNDDFFKGKRLENDPLYTLQAHFVYQFKPGFWWAGGAGYGYGAESTLNGTRKEDGRENLVWGTSLGYPITRRLAAKLGYIGTRTQTSLGANTDTVVTARSLFW